MRSEAAQKRTPTPLDAQVDELENVEEIRLPAAGRRRASVKNEPKKLSCPDVSASARPEDQKTGSAWMDESGEERHPSDSQAQSDVPELSARPVRRSVLDTRDAPGAPDVLDAQKRQVPN